MATKKTATKKTASSKAANPLVVGNKVIIRTVTHYHIGRIAEIGEHEILLTEASWVADTRRWSLSLLNGFPPEAEVEPMPDPVLVGRGAVVDLTTWRHALNR